MTTDANITQSFIAMVEAYKAKPELEAEIVRLEEDRDFFERHLTIANDLSSKLYADIDALNAKLLEVSRERDDAMFRNLELEELKDKIGGLVGQALGLFKSSSPEPTQPVTVAEPEPFTDAHPVWKPVSEMQPDTAGPIMSQSEPMAFGVEETDMPSAKPADTSIWPAGPIDPVVVEPQPLVQPEPAPQPSLSPGEPDGWERGKPYSYKPWYMNDAEWISRGGFGPAKDELATDTAWQF